MCQRSAVTTAASDWRALVFAFVSSHSHSHTCSGRSEIPKMSANNDGVEATALCRRALGLLTLYNKGGRHDWTDSLFVFARPLTTRPVASHQHAGYRLRFGRLSQSTPYSASPHESHPKEHWIHSPRPIIQSLRLVVVISGRAYRCPAVNSADGRPSVAHLQL